MRKEEGKKARQQTNSKSRKVGKCLGDYDRGGDERETYGPLSRNSRKKEHRINRQLFSFGFSMCGDDFLFFIF